MKSILFYQTVLRVGEIILRKRMTVPKFSLWNDDKLNIQEQSALLFFGDKHNAEPRLIIKLYHIKVEAFTSHSLISLSPAYSLDWRHYLTAKKDIS